MTATPNFNQLSESEQRAVAERLLKIKESGWKPFWCPDPNCDGLPHQIIEDDGTGLWMGADDTEGPNGEPLGNVVEFEDGARLRPILDPQWAHNHARSDQRLPPWLRPWTLFIMSGRGCVAPWTLIDLADGTRERIDVLAQRGEAVEVMTPDGPRWTDGAPFLKGEAHQWRVRLSTGRVLTVTDKHRFLAPGGWLQLDHVRAGQPLVAAPLDQPSTDGLGSRDALSGWREDAHRCWRTELDSGCGCPTCRRQGDLPLPEFPETARGGAPSQADAAARTRPASASDDRAASPADSRACPQSDPLSRSRSGLFGASLEGGQSRDGSVLVGSSPRSQGIVATSPESTDPQPPMPGDQIRQEGSAVARRYGLLRLLGEGASALLGVTRRVLRRSLHSLQSPPRNERSDLVWVESIEYSHFGPFYDLTVPGPSSYNTEGVVSHNSGKTTLGTEFVTLSARKGLDGAILGRRGTELVNTHVATIIERAHPEFVPIHWASKDILEWPNGAITYLFSAEKPENIRSVNLSYALVDEAAFMDEIETAWMNLKLATRISKPNNPIHILITSTPTSTQWVMDMEDDPDVEVRRVSTYANRENLAPEFLAMLEKEYEGTRMGRQELHGEVLRDVEGALWNDEMFKHLRVDAVEFANMIDSMDDRVIAVDPAGSKGPRSDATGIIGVGAQHFDDAGEYLSATNFFVMARATIKGSPTEWAEQTFKAARLMRANRIVAEKNFGGDMVKQVLTDYAKLHPEIAKDINGEDYRIDVVHAAKSKETRAEGTVGKYEQGLVCVDGEALVPTHRGVIPLREVMVDDYVLTRVGLRRVTAVWDQGVRDVVEVVTTEGSVAVTGDHEVFTSNRGWVHASTLVPTDTVLAWGSYASTAGQVHRAENQSHAATPARPSTCGAPASRSGSFRSTTASGTTSKTMVTGALDDTLVENSSTGKSGETKTDPYLTDGTSTTSTTTRATTPWRTLRQSLRVSTPRTTTRPLSESGPKTRSTLRRALGWLGLAPRSTETSRARNAAPSSAAPRQTATSGSALPPVTRAGGIVSVQPAGRRHVYDISVEEHPEFFANGVLVHNCHVTSPTAFGDLSELEKQQVNWVPKSRGGRSPSPNDVDALVWAVRALETKLRFQGQQANSRDVMKRLKRF